MFLRKRYSQSNNEVMDKNNMICKSTERAYRYYSVIFKKDYPKQSVKGKERYLCTNTSYNLELPEYIFFINFETVDIGKPAALDEAGYLLVEGVRLNYCSGKFDISEINEVLFKYDQPRWEDRQWDFF